jgi:hemerythrin-like domain-containing protein
MTSPLLPGHRSPAVGFEQPFEMLEACHERIRRSLDLLGRLVDHAALNGADDAARSAAADVLRYFTLAAPAHHEDEERHLVPRLRASGQPEAVAAAERILQDHHALRDAWSGLQPLLADVAAGNLPPHDALRDAASRFIDLHTPHLSLEDTFAFPAGRVIAEAQGPQAVAEMGREMAARRGQRND